MLLDLLLLFFPLGLLQKHQAYVKQFEVDKVKTEHEERRKTMGAEVKQHQERAKFEDQLARRRYDDQLSQQVELTLCMSLCVEKKLVVMLCFALYVRAVISAWEHGVMLLYLFSLY